MTEFPELQQFDAEFKPGTIKRPGLDSLADGDHDFEILGCELARTEKTNEAILRMLLQVRGGSTIEKVYFFRNQQAVDMLATDLCTLGIDADKWQAPARPFSAELAKALPRLVGVRFRGKKVTLENPKDISKPYHNLYINQRLGEGSTPLPPPPVAATPPNGSSVPSSDPIPW